ncbi:hypothetical protein T07_9249 [Trichinella nelsoni]|uniref:Uncharacterized protein n=1 Tax=Trichinella nelsoni TaxID=6336 RepID=A0A0V0S7N8_9BILA|nr:hypothetical protein T07_9249 [Trichinella nelsoni]
MFRCVGHWHDDEGTKLFVIPFPAFHSQLRARCARDEGSQPSNREIENENPAEVSLLQRSLSKHKTNPSRELTEFYNEVVSDASTSLDTSAFFLT